MQREASLMAELSFTGVEHLKAGVSSHPVSGSQVQEIMFEF